MKNKVWTGLLICILMVCCVSLDGSAQSSPADAIVLEPGSNVSVMIGNGDTTFLSFTPDISHNYDFYPVSWDHYEAKLYTMADGELQEIETTDIDTYYSFRIRAFLNAGTTYYLGLSDPNGMQSRYVTVYSAMANNLCVSTEANTVNHLKTIYVNFGESITLQTYVTADYTERVTYWWQIAEYIPGTAGFQASVIEGANGSSLTTQSISYKTYYHCYIADGFGNEDSVVYTVDIDNNFTVSADEKTLSDHKTCTVSIGESVELKVYVNANNTEGLFCIWTRSAYKQETDRWVETVLEGETGTSLITEAIRERISYACTVIDRYGHVKDIYFTVLPENHLAVSTEESVISDSRYLFFIPGKETTLQVYVTADDTSGITYSWSGTEYYYSGGAYYGYGISCDCTESVLRLNNVPTRTQYACRVTDKYGESETVSFYLSVKNNLSLSTEEGKHSIQRDIHARYGEKVTLKAFVTADDTNDMVYEWYCNAFDDQTETWSDLEYIPDATGDTVTTKAITGWTNYSCSVVDRYGNTTLVSYFLDNDSEQHPWGMPIYKWSEDYLSVTAEAVCTENESHVLRETVLTGKTMLHPTESAAGGIKYSASFSYTIFETQSHIIEIPSLSEMRCLHLPEQLSTIDDEAFMGTEAQAIIIPDGCNRIGNLAFANSPDLIYVMIPSSVTEMAENAFQGCESVIFDYK